MILLKPSAVIEDLPPGDEVIARIERAARTCYKSDMAHEIAAQKLLRDLKFLPGDPDKSRRIMADLQVTEAFVRKLLQMGHESTIEHVSATVRFIVDRGVAHELVRHRLAAYSQESTRYVDYTRDDKSQGHCQFIIPPWCNLKPGVYTTEHRIVEGPEAGSVSGNLCFKCDGEWVEFPEFAPDKQWLAAMMDAERFYQSLRKVGWSPQQARSVLPTSTKTEIVMTANLREFRHIFRMRTSPAAHPQMREVMIPLLAEFRARVPVLFDDVFPPEKKISDPVESLSCIRDPNPMARADSFVSAYPENQAHSGGVTVKAYRRICGACGTVTFFTDHKTGTGLNAAEVKAWRDRMHTCQMCGVTGEAVKVEPDPDSFTPKPLTPVDFL